MFSIVLKHPALHVKLGSNNQNVQYLCNKLETVDHFLLEIISNISEFTEHGLSENSLNVIKLEGSYLASSYSRSLHKGGGVAIYVSDLIKS